MHFVKWETMRKRVGLTLKKEKKTFIYYDKIIHDINIKIFVMLKVISKTALTNPYANLYGATFSGYLNR